MSQLILSPIVASQGKNLVKKFTGHPHEENYWANCGEGQGVGRVQVQRKRRRAGDGSSNPKEREAE